MTSPAENAARLGAALGGHAPASPADNAATVRVALHLQTSVVRSKEGQDALAALAALLAQAEAALSDRSLL